VVGAVALGRSRVQVGICDLTGVVLAHVEEPLDVTVGPDQVMTLVVDRIRAVLWELGRTVADLRGIGMSMPGIVDRERGASTATPLMPSWEGVPLAPYLSDLAPADHVPAVFDNDVLVLALSERDGHLRQHTDLVALKASTGLGVGVVTGGRVLHGGRGAAGEIGHARSAAADDRPCRCGERGCLETVAGGWALVQEMRERGRDVGHVRDLVALVRTGDPEARTLVRDAGRRVGEVLATAVTLLNPTAIVIGGDMAPAYDTFAAGLRETLYANATAFATRDLAILESTHGEMAGLVGSGLLALEHVLSPAYVDRVVQAAG
jgi:predicted NBD/HSP70 family sugar kinase